MEEMHRDLGQELPLLFLPLALPPSPSPSPSPSPFLPISCITHDSLASATQLLGLQACTTTPGRQEGVANAQVLKQEQG